MNMADVPVLAIRVVGVNVIKRRELLQRDPPFDFAGALTSIRRATGLGSGELAFVLNIARSTLWSIEERRSRPNADDGDAIRKLLRQIEEENAA